jgi:hypothetical protein
MTRSTVGGRFLEALLFAVSSLALYSFGFGRILFLVPLQVLAVRRGLPGLAAAGALGVLGLAAMRLAELLPGPLAAGDLLPAGAELAVFLLLAAALAAVNLSWGRARTLVRLLAASVAVCAAGAPLVAALAASPEVRTVVDGVFAETTAMLRSVFTTGDSVAGTVLETLLVPATLKAVVRESLLSGFVPAVFAFLAFSWWAGSAAGRRAVPAGQPARAWRFAVFRLEAWWLWPLIVSLALVLAVTLFADAASAPAWLAYASYPAWNAALLLLFLFGLQGLAILRFLLEKRGIARFLWPLLVAAVAAALATPRLNLAAALVLPLFGASENWVRYRHDGGAAPA